MAGDIDLRITALGNHLQPLPLEIFEHRLGQFGRNSLSGIPLRHPRVGQNDDVRTYSLVINDSNIIAQIELVAARTDSVFQLISFPQTKVSL